MMRRIASAVPSRNGGCRVASSIMSCTPLLCGSTIPPSQQRHQCRWLSTAPSIAGAGGDLAEFRARYESHLPPVPMQSQRQLQEHEQDLAAAVGGGGGKKKKNKGKGTTPDPTAASTSSTTEAGQQPPPLVAATTAPMPYLVRGRAERCRGHGKIAFLHLRQPPGESIQVVCFGKELAAAARAIPPESLVEVAGEMRPTQAGSGPVLSATCSYHELHATALRVISAAATPLPFPVNDLRAKLDTRLNYRAVDLRTRLSSSVLRIASAVCQSYRSALLELDFIEIHTPKLVAAASEGGSAVFEVKYFTGTEGGDDGVDNSGGGGVGGGRRPHRRAYLAQSPQLYKQMAINGDAMRVFEIGPVFRAEKSLTHRHLTEFTGLDAEMVIGESYTEVLDVLEYVMCTVLYNLSGDKSVRAPSQAARLVATARMALREQAEAERLSSSSSSSSSSPSPSGVSTATTATATATTGEAQSSAESGATDAVTDLIFELSHETIARCGIRCDSSPSTSGAATDACTGSDAAISAEGCSHHQLKSEVDRYNARIGDGTIRRRTCTGAPLDSTASSPSSPFVTVACPRVLRLSFDDAVRLLFSDGDVATTSATAVHTSEQPPPPPPPPQPQLLMDDFSLPQERRLGELVKARYGVDLYVVDLWPVSARPFYTMPCAAAETPDCDAVGGDGVGGSNTPPLRPPLPPPQQQQRQQRTRSYDMYLRGEEICSGAQRQHDAARLTEQLAATGINITSADGVALGTQGDAGNNSNGLKDYVDSFRYGAWPHGGFGLGLERIVSFFLGAKDIRQVSMFPRDPKRLTP